MAAPANQAAVGSGSVRPRAIRHRLAAATVSGSADAKVRNVSKAFGRGAVMRSGTIVQGACAASRATGQSASVPTAVNAAQAAPGAAGAKRRARPSIISAQTAANTGRPAPT